MLQENSAHDVEQKCPLANNVHCPVTSSQRWYASKRWFPISWCIAKRVWTATYLVLLISLYLPQLKMIQPDTENSLMPLQRDAHNRIHNSALCTLWCVCQHFQVIGISPDNNAVPNNSMPWWRQTGSCLWNQQQPEIVDFNFQNEGTDLCMSILKIRDLTQPCTDVHWTLGMFCKSSDATQPSSKSQFPFHHNKVQERGWQFLICSAQAVMLHSPAVNYNFHFTIAKFSK